MGLVRARWHHGQRTVLPTRKMAAQNLLDDPVGPTLYRLSMPMAVGIVFMFVVNLVDTYWASRLGTDALAAMSFAFPIIGVVLNVSLGLMIGTSVAVARLVGSGDEDAARQVSTHAIWLGLVIVCAVTGVGLVTQDLVFSALGAPPELLPVISGYMRIWYVSAVFLVVPMMLNGVLRAHGDAITARNVMILSAVANAVFDPLLIFGWGPVPAFGLEGAAMATALSRALTLLYAGIVAVRMNSLELAIPGLASMWRSWKIILHVGVPATVTNVLGPLAVAVLTAIVASHGAAAVAAYGIGARLESLFLVPASALSSGLSPFVGQNWGAHLASRVASGVRLANRFSVVWGLIAIVVLLVGAPVIASVFTEDPDVHRNLVNYLRIAPLGYGAYSAMMMVSSAFNAVDHAGRATVLSVLRSLVLAVPLAIVGSELAGPAGIFAGLAASSILAGLVGVQWMRRFLAAEDGLRFDTPATLSDADFLVDRTRPEHRVVTQALVDHVLELEDVELHRTRRDAVGVYADDRELGHLHPSGHLDLCLPPEIGDALVVDTDLAHHRMQDGGWYTHDLCSEGDTRHAQWLLRLAHALYEARKRGPEHPITRTELRALALSGSVADAVEQTLERW